MPILGKRYVVAPLLYSVCVILCKTALALIVGGQEEHEKVAEIVDLLAEPCHDDCSKVNISFPIQLTSGSTGALVDGTPIVCGGLYEEANADHAYQNQGCYKLVGNSAIFMGNLTRPRTNAASFEFDHRLWVTGHHNFVTKSTELIDLNGKVEQGPDLPERLFHHCLLRYQ